MTLGVLRWLNQKLYNQVLNEQKLNEQVAQGPSPTQNRTQRPEGARESTTGQRMNETKNGGRVKPQPKKANPTTNPRQDKPAHASS